MEDGKCLEQKSPTDTAIFPVLLLSRPPSQTLWSGILNALRHDAQVGPTAPLSIGSLYLEVEIQRGVLQFN